MDPAARRWRNKTNGERSYQTAFSFWACSNFPLLLRCEDAPALKKMKYSYIELAKMIDHSLLHPTLTDDELEQGCKLAASYEVASVCIKPYFVKRAAEILQGTGVLVGTVVGFPHGSSSTEVKRFETKTACEDGAVEIDMVINIGKALSGDWKTVESDIRAVCETAHGFGAIVKVILENDFLPSDELKEKLCQICERAGADFVKTSTGFGFVKQPGGNFNYKGATESDLKLMRASCSSRVQVKAAGGIRDLDALIRVRELGVARCGTSATIQLLEEYRRRVGQASPSVENRTILGQGGY
jgi:deoxyribose-phosphate aldolase